MQNLEVLYEDNHIIAVVKKAGILTQGDDSGEISLLDMVKTFLKEKYKKPGNVFLGLLHRLDRNVSGIVIFAKTSKGASRISEQIRNHQLEKIYTAKVEGILKNKKNTLVHFLERDEIKNKTFITENKNAQKAELSYEVLKENIDQDFSILRISLKTGRHHQIRAQLAEIGHPICGDKKYGSKIVYPDQHIDLISSEISFKAPTEEKKIKIVYNHGL